MGDIIICDLLLLLPLLLLMMGTPASIHSQL